MYDDFLSIENGFLMMVEPVFVIQFNAVSYKGKNEGKGEGFAHYSVGQSREGGKVRLSPSMAGVSWGPVS